MKMKTLLEHPAEATLFDSTLSQEARLPAVFIPGGVSGRLEHAENLLRHMGLIEDHRHEACQNEHEDGVSSAQRLEAKLDLSMLLIGRILEQSSIPLSVREVRWSIRGARLEQPDTGALAIGVEGVLQIQPYDWLPESLTLPVRVLAQDPGRWLWMSFPSFAPGLNDALERHLFRQHRRQIAQARMATGDR